jgi:ankyrin repeat protein
MFYFSTALHLSVLNENTALFDLLLSCPGLAVDTTTQEGHCALRFALLRNGLDIESMASRLLKAKANPNLVYPTSGDTLLHLLAKEKKEEAAIFLCHNGIFFKTFCENSSMQLIFPRW